VEIRAVLGTNAIDGDDIHDNTPEDAELDDSMRVEANTVSKQR
jgi:hypothetical protein